MKPSSPSPSPRTGWLVAAAIVTVSVSGYFMGLRQTGSQISMTRPLSLVEGRPDGRALSFTGAVPEAVRYADQDWSRDGANGSWGSRLALLARSPTSPSPGTNATDAERAIAIADRMGRRAYDGAPPVIPHPITQDTSAACLACHAEGAVVKDRVAPRISHLPHASCTQCHVPSTGLPVQDARLAEAIAGNGFQGWIQPGRGTRAWEGAPPTVPHATQMRSDCLSCHGERGHAGLRTPHPERQACLQCHVPDAALDGHRFLPVDTSASQGAAVGISGLAP